MYLRSCQDLRTDEEKPRGQEEQARDDVKTNNSAQTCQLLGLPLWASALHSRACDGPYNASGVGADIMLRQTQFSRGISIPAYSGTIRGGGVSFI